LVTCLYRLAAPGHRAEQAEALAVNADFWSQVLQSRTLWPMDFAMGAAVAIRREWLAKAGGLEALADQLADDFQLGNRVYRAGGRVDLGPRVVECWEVRGGWAEVWRRQLRWARTIRASRPVPFFLSVLNNVTVWGLGLIGAGAAAAGLGGVGWGFGSVGLGVLAVGLRLGIAMDLQARWVPEPSWRAPWWMVPVRDFLGGLIWIGAFAGRRVEWRGRRFRVSAGGWLRPADPAE
jgi:ceramide glucosyltransferase